MRPFPAAFLGMSEILPKVELNLMMSNRLIIKPGAEKAGSPVIPVQGGSLPSLEEKEKSPDADGLTPARWVPGAGSPLCSPPKARAWQSPGAGPCFRAATGTETGEENKAPQGENDHGGSQGPSGGDVPSCALNTALEKRFCSAQGLWKRFKFQSHVRLC